MCSLSKKGVQVYQIFNKLPDNRVIIGRKCDLTASEKSVITSELARGHPTLEISKTIGRYHQTVKTNVIVSTKIRKRADKGSVEGSSSTFSVAN
ncbi:Hypothetical predicted protein [Octopus vulgaris]|uniref:Transposase IS30-like HTH domain-containing protein n=1 Tax=Octopus vulgaris TaxID=6645 RepID=A0AA36EXF0_OCTVU|nr:Hypothetical predicted protein [Octopus vulgaris]